ncbi:excinuclease ABC subunit UvrC [Flocculibacter collagenilyticus]|uniref:excinuclease ABC subunit UvrC n=1 Tax=Flocculibacter collagenilyticus TaxID=2744479 RepID=UPI0018F6ED31|nr:excinuclease ABC subunit UvrC [Flocculibacter collagenilyticus]
MTSKFDANHFLSKLTEQPGVYRMYNTAEEVIYVGKAKNLKKRLSSYFRGTITNAKTRTLVSHIANIEITVTHTESEALILENNLIKKYLPKYNVLLRDDKSYPFILITDHKHPKIGLHRGARKVKGDYFGPYPSSGAVWESLRLMQKIFPIRQCEDNFYKSRTRPCLQYQLKRCSGPCVDKISVDDYQEQVNLAKLFLNGKNKTVIAALVKKMEKASSELAFEQAASYRDQISVLRKVQEQQYVSGDVPELDVIGFHYENGVAAIHVLFIRDHKVLGSKNYFPKIPKSSDTEEVLTAFILQFYMNGYGGQAMPKEITLPFAIDEQAGLQGALSEIAQRKVKLKTISRGEKLRYLSLANKNASIAVKTKLVEKGAVAQRYKELNEYLNLDNTISRMECFDISHTSGQQTIASCVVFNDQGPFKQEYRRYNVEGITPGDDYAAMRFALAKRYDKVKDETKIPDVIFIDGGKGQLTQAEEYFESWSHNKFPMLIGVAKGTSRKPGLETLIFNGGSKEVSLPSDSLALHLIQHIRDEAHRFAITGHRNKRAKVKATSPLESIQGVGPKRRQALLKYLGGQQGITSASIDELAKVPGISKELAENIFHTLHDKS